jgi:hypothetical protein
MFVATVLIAVAVIAMLTALFRSLGRKAQSIILKALIVCIAAFGIVSVVVYDRINSLPPSSSYKLVRVVIAAANRGDVDTFSKHVAADGRVSWWDFMNSLDMSHFKEEPTCHSREVATVGPQVFVQSDCGGTAFGYNVCGGIIRSAFAVGHLNGIQVQWLRLLQFLEVRPSDANSRCDVPKK